MNPVPVMKLVEVVRGLPPTTRPTATVAPGATASARTVVTAKDIPGFIVNRMLIPFLNEACFALQEASAPPRTSTRASSSG